MKKLVFTILISALPFWLMGATITAVGGEWTDPTSWDSNPTLPVDGDIIIIPDGVTITITDQVINFNGAITIESGATLSLIDTGLFFGLPVPPFASLVMSDAGSTVTIETGGQIISASESALDPNNISVGGNPFAYLPGLGIGDNPQIGPATITDGGVVPVELIHFTANTKTSSVVLAWATAQEENFDFFSVERSSDGTNFKEIAQINGSGNSVTRIDYEYQDEFPIIGISYYRLTSIDFDGYTEIFDYVVVNVEGIRDDFAVFPNPVVEGNFSIQTNFAPESALDLVIYNNVGRVEGEYKINDWLNAFESTDLQTGSYILKLATPSGVIVKRILVK